MDRSEFEVAQSPERLRELSDSELDQLVPKLLDARLSDGAPHMLGCRCGGINKPDGSRVTDGDVMLAMDEWRRRREV